MSVPVDDASQLERLFPKNASISFVHFDAREGSDKAEGITCSALHCAKHLEQ